MGLKLSCGYAGIRAILQMSNLSRFMLGLLVLIVLVFTGGKAMAIEEQLLSDIKDLQWEKRVILLKTDEQSFPDFERLLKNQREAIIDRHVTWLIFNENRIATNYTGPLAEELKKKLMNDYFDNSSSRNEIVLIGKDGGVKLRTDTLNPDEIFGLIDSMPMRKQEMTEKR